MLLKVRDSIDCALLFDKRYAAVDPFELEKFLRQSFPARDFTLRRAEGESILIVGAPPLFVSVAQNRTALAPEGFERALASPLLRMNCPETAKALARHTSNVFITVSEDPLLGAADALKLQLGMEEEAKPARLVEEKIAICQRVATFLAEKLKPTVIHWCQSNQLLSREMFLGLKDMEFPSPIHVHAFLFSSTGDPGRVGFVTGGARYVIGREISFAESSADFLWAYTKALDFLIMTRRNNYELIPDGHTFGSSKEEMIRVRHLPAKEGEVPVIELTVVRAPQFGIGV